MNEPSPDCPLCPRLHNFLQSWRGKEPHWHNAPVPVFPPTDPQEENAKRVRTTSLASCDDRAKLLIIGLAPGIRGANRTGRPFTGDYAGNLLYSTLIDFGFAQGTFKAEPDDSLTLNDCAIVNAVRCVPPENKPTASEINQCRQFLTPTISRFKNLRAIITLGTIAHQSTIRALGEPAARYKFSHGAQHDVGAYRVFSSYHCSRYNTNTGVLTERMFRDVFKAVRNYLDECSAPSSDS